MKFFRRFFIYFVLCSIFSPLIAKEKRAPLSLQEDVAVYRQIQAYLIEAEEAIEVGGYQRAKALYMKVLEMPFRENLSLEESQNFLLSLVSIEIHLSQFEKAQELLKGLDSQKLNKEQLFRKELLKANLYYSKEDRFHAMQQLNRLLLTRPMNYWPMQERSFYLQVSKEVNPYFEELLDQAEECFSVSLYQEAFPLYQEVYTALDQDFYRSDDELFYEKISLKLGATHFFLKDYLKAEELLSQIYREKQGFIDLESLYLLLLASEKNQHFEKALAYCNEYIHRGPHHSQEQLESVLFERALLHYKLGQDTKAQEHFIQLTKEIKSIHYQALSRFYLARLFIKNGKYEQVEYWMNPKQFDLSSLPNLKCDATYLRAEALYHRKEYARAIPYFEEALLERSKENIFWYPSALYYLGDSYLKLAGKANSSYQAQENGLDQAEKAFLELLELGPSEKGVLALAKVFQSQHRLLKKEVSLDRLNAFLEKYPLTDQRLFLETSLIRAELTLKNHFEEKEALYFGLLKLESLNEFERAKINFLRGENFFHWAAKSHQRGFYEKSVECLRDCWPNLYPKQVDSLLPTLKMLAMASMNVGELKLLLSTYHFFEELSYQTSHGYEDENLFDLSLYYRALLASKLMAFEGQSAYLDRGIESLERLLKKRAKGVLVEQSLYLLATLLYQQEDYISSRQTFLKLIEQFPQSKRVGDAYFWVAECHDQEKNDPLLSKECRKCVFQKYPSSSHAAEAYFYIHSFEDYLEGKPAALSHLKEMEELFPKSPLIMVSDYLQALNKKKENDQGKMGSKKDFLASAALFEKVEQTFLKAYSEWDIYPHYFHYLTELYYQSILGKAEAYLDQSAIDSSGQRKGHLQLAIEAYSKIRDDFQDPKAFLTKPFYRPSSHSDILDQAELGLAMALIKNFQLKEGEALLRKIFFSEQAKENKYLSKACYELAFIEMAKENYPGALDLLERASISSLDQLSEDQRVEIMIQKSLCYRFLGEWDQAMLILSKVINEEPNSPLSVKAMVLRSEIYALQGRNELAQKQLEIAAKKRGDWAQISKDRLVANYEVN